ncbi:MAG: type II toxin-antitoxin system VapC family toxin [Sheuella sp.]|nr:type II toxin-antitoxin system VapC family toxin [Sheuella sp.]
MIYVDTSVFVSLLTRENKTNDVNRWYANCDQTLASSEWCITEFASALALKQRTGQIDQSFSDTAWEQFQTLCKRDLTLLPVASAHFYKAAVSVLNTTLGLRAGDALHLAVALEYKAQGIVSLDTGLLKNAKQLKIKPIFI